MTFLALVPRWVWLALAGAGALFFFAKWQQGIGEARVREEYAQAERAAIAQRLEENAELERLQARQYAALKKGHRDEIEHIKRTAADVAAGGLRLPPSTCAGAAAAAKAEGSTGSAAGAAAPIFLPQRITADLLALMEKADTIVAGCRVGQKFIIENGFKE